MADAFGLAALIMSMLLFFAILFVAIYVYTALVLMVIAKKTKTPNGWLAWIPIANFVLMLNIAKIDWWWLLIGIAAIILSMIPIVGVIINLALIVGVIYLWWRICEEVKKPGWWGILMMIPIVNWVLMGIMAWGK
ncbi:MAG: hypothetical protein V1725_05065 [archaeon]